MSAINNETIRIILSEVTNAVSYVVQYSTTLSFDSFSTLTPNAGETLLTGLNPGTTYYFRAKSTGNDNYRDSVFTDVLSVKTLMPITGLTLDNTTPDVGDILRAYITPSDATVVWAWFRNDTLIEGVTASSYTVTAADLGATIQTQATAEY